MGIGKEHIFAVVGIVITIAIPVAIILALPSPEQTKLVAAKVTEGNVVGLYTEEAGIFWGIPFSQPPIGDYRWRKPRNPLKYSTKYWDATYKRPGCDQICDQPVAEYSCPHATSEDCLYLNVWVPSRAIVPAKPDGVIDGDHYSINPSFFDGTNKPLAVMVWFYGGNFRNGAGSCTLYDGRYMADQGDVIVVTTNYRVAHLGFLVQGEDGEESKGNFGFWDQVKTLEWVRDNIANFGGDPTQVTLFGQSAGAESIGVHLTSEVSKDMFSRTIMQSNPFGLPFREMTDAKKFGDAFTLAANCTINNMTCLRSRTVKELEAAYNGTLTEITDPNRITLIFQQWSPVIDGDVVPAQPIDLFAQNKEQNKPMMMGATADETMIYVAEAFPSAMDAATYKILLRVVFKDNYPPVIAKYPPECEESITCDNRDAVNVLATDFLFQCAQRKALNSTDIKPRWWYIFNETWSFYQAWEVPLCFDKVCHAAEMAYVFGVEPLTTFRYTEEERQLTKRIIKYWTNFAKFGNPNDPSTKTSDSLSTNQLDDVIEWPAFDERSSAVDEYEALQLTGEGDIVMKKPYKDNCDFWDDLDSYADHFKLP